MLYLEPPFLTIEGVGVCRDHADPLQWYYMPGSPRLATVGGVPQLSLIRFKGSAGTGGFVNFDVDLGVDPELLDEIGRQISAEAGLGARPRLAGIPVVDGTVRMFLFDAETPTEPPPDGDPAPSPGTQFVLRLSHPARPALYGDHRATFSVQLSQPGVTLLERALRGEMSPIGVVYSLDFLALRPAYHVQARIDWDVVQKHVHEHKGFKIPIVYSSEIDRFVDSLIESREIEFTVDNFLLEDDGSPAMARLDRAIDDVRDMITETFFEPVLDPIDRSDGAGKAVRTAGRIQQAIITGGASEMQAFQRRKIEATRIERKRLNVSMSERSAVQRTIYPQGHLAGMIRIADEDWSRFVTEVDLDDPWFEQRSLTVISRAEWELDAVQSISVTARYGDLFASALLTPSQPEWELRWASRLEAGAMVREVELTYTVTFTRIDGTQRPRQLTSATRTERGDAVEIDPRELFSVDVVPIRSINYPFDRYSLAQVEVSNTDPGNAIAEQSTFWLSSENPLTLWRRFILDESRTETRYRITHRARDHRDVMGEWRELDRDELLVEDPYPATRVLDVVSNLNWAEVEHAFVDLSYRDAEHGIAEEASFAFTSDSGQVQQFRAAVADPTRREVEYRVDILRRDGAMVRVPASRTLERRIIIREDMRGRALVRIRLVPGTSLATLGIREVNVNLRYVDRTSGLDIAGRALLRSSEDAGTFEFDYAQESSTSYQFQVVSLYLNNLTRTTPWAASDEADLVVHPA